FFGEGLPEEYGSCLNEDRLKVDLLIVIGTSLKVRPVSEIATIFPSHVPSILINRAPNTAIDFDIQLLGFSDVIVAELCSRLGWELPRNLPAQEKLSIPDLSEWASLCKPCHWHVFPGAQTAELLAEGLSFTPDCSSTSDSEPDVNPTRL
ncbi:NAD-dependent protein deacetylase sirtuin-1, partial [Massospora cicadina]